MTEKKVRKQGVGGGETKERDEGEEREEKQEGRKGKIEQGRKGGRKVYIHITELVLTVLMFLIELALAVLSSFGPSYLLCFVLPS
jgi:hypothetical protein